jgi:KDO2-lipid IV(A) lauroyltransferase
MARKSRIQTWVEYAAMRGALGLLSMLPRSTAHVLGRTLSRATFRILAGRLDSGIRNLEIAFPEMSADERKRVLRSSVENIGRTVVEFAHFRPENAAEAAQAIEFDFDSDEFAVYKKAKAEGRGVLMPTAHIGNWEVLLSGFAMQYEPIHFTARELDNPRIDKMFASKRARFGSRQFYKSDSAKDVLRALKAGESVGVLPDVNVLPNEGVFVPFFDFPACTTSGPARLAIKADALIFPMFAVWDDGRKKYIVHNGHPIEPSNTGDKERDVVETTAAFTAEIERIVRRFPEQWLWIHRRWKTRPPGEPELY